MKKYLVSLRIGGQSVKTVVFADSVIHARLLAQYKYGMNSLASTPVRVAEDAALPEGGTQMVKPKPPMKPAQARLHALKQGVERSREQLRAERERQRQQREAGRLR